MLDRPPSRTFRFGGFVLNLSGYELTREGRRIRIEPRPLELLMLLVNRRGELVTREEIVQTLWSRDVFIDIDTSVNTVVRKLRRALRDSASIRASSKQYKAGGIALLQTSNRRVPLSSPCCHSRIFSATASWTTSQTG
jgi:DNA-binding SARP family transcriptional activator